MIVMGENIKVTLSSKRIQDLYDKSSYFYDYLTGHEVGAKRDVLKSVRIKNGSKVLEIGFGTGKVLVELSRKYKNKGEVYGLDLSKRMADKARKYIERRAINHNIDVMVGDALYLPFPDSCFDMLFSSYMLDLIDTPRIPNILLEFRRVLKKGGRLILVSMSKGSKWYNNMWLYERVYKRMPLLLGGCRPVLLRPFLEELEFRNIKSKCVFVGGLVPTEILYVDK